MEVKDNEVREHIMSVKFVKRFRRNISAAYGRVKTIALFFGSRPRYQLLPSVLSQRGSPEMRRCAWKDQIHVNFRCMFGGWPDSNIAVVK